jgi:hypothetical protein
VVGENGQHVSAKHDRLGSVEDSYLIACIVIASAKRRTLLDEKVVPSVLAQGFTEIVIVGDYKSGDGYRHLPVPPLTNSTRDAQVKRDVATMATTSDWLVYVCDDHALAPDFLKQLRIARRAHEKGLQDWQIGVPSRFCKRDGETVPLNMGLPDYCGGHAGVFPRKAIQELPWSVAPFHPNWDVLHSRMLTSRGYELIELPDCFVEDLEVEAQPWR